MDKTEPCVLSAGKKKDIQFTITHTIKSKMQSIAFNTSTET